MGAEKYAGKRLLDVWADAAAKGVPHASVCFTEAEALICAHEEIVTMKAIGRLAGGLLITMPLSGVALPDPLARIRLVDALKEADLIGILEHHDDPRWKYAADSVMQYYNIEPHGTFFAYENLFLAKMKAFYRIFREYRVLLVGEHAAQCAEVMSRRYGWNVVGTLHCPLADGLDRAQKAMERMEFEVAFAAGSVPSRMLASYAKRLGRVGIDIGESMELWLRSDAEGTDAWQWPMERLPRRNWGN
jgi:hypothetical protein